MVGQGLRVVAAETVDADDVAEVAGAAASTPASASSNTHACAAARRRAARAPARNESGAGLPFRCSSAIVLPSTRTSSRSAMPAPSTTLWQFALEETTAVRRPSSRTAFSSCTDPG